MSNDKYSAMVNAFESLASEAHVDSFMKEILSWGGAWVTFHTWLLSNQIAKSLIFPRAYCTRDVFQFDDDVFSTNNVSE